MGNGELARLPLDPLAAGEFDTALDQRREAKECSDSDAAVLVGAPRHAAALCVRVCVCACVCVCSASYACLTCAGEEAVCVIFIIFFQEQTEPIHVPSSTYLHIPIST